MYTFALHRIEAVKGKQSFFHLEIDGRSEFKSFCENLESNPQYRSEILRLFSIMDLVSNLRLLPDTKVKDITPKKELIKEYEFKSRNLRVYAFKTDDGKIIVSGGFKTDQKRDLAHFRRIKKSYLSNKG